VKNEKKTKPTSVAGKKGEHRVEIKKTGAQTLGKKVLNGKRGKRRRECPVPKT